MKNKHYIAFGIFALVLIASLAGCSKTMYNQPPRNNTQIANPASVYCEEQGGTVQIVTAADGSQSGMCKFSTGKECDEWEFYRGNCTK